MKPIIRAWWIIILATTVAWLSAEPDVLAVTGLMPLRNLAVQYSGLLAMAAMSIAMALAARPGWLERRLGGLDKMYRLHKWLGITVLIFAVVHWIACNAPGWAATLDLIDPIRRGPRPPSDNPIQQFFGSYRWLAKLLGEWAFYATVALGILALVKRVPYRIFYRTHRLFAPVYLALAVHTVVLTKFAYWGTAAGFMLAPLLVLGSWGAVLSLTRRIGHSRRTRGVISNLHYYPGVHALETDVDLVGPWQGHKPGQFAFVTSDVREGAHPYTIASAWTPHTSKIKFIVKSLGDHTGGLREALHIGQSVGIEGPYGCFTFEDDAPEQIWIGGGIGITPFIARMKQIAAAGPRMGQKIHLFHATAEEDKGALARLSADAEAAGVDVHVTIDARDGLLTGEQIHKAVPNWRDASIWFCGPTGLGDVLRRDFAAKGFDIDGRFHQELFQMR